MKIKLLIGKPIRPRHGPQVWEWYRLFALHLCRLGYHSGSLASGYRLWLYTRWGAPHLDIVFIRKALCA